MRPASASTSRLAGPWKTQKNSTPGPTRTKHEPPHGSTNRPASAAPTRRPNTAFSEASHRFSVDVNERLPPEFRSQGLFWTADPDMSQMRMRSAKRAHGVEETFTVAVPSIEIHLELPPRKGDLQEATTGRLTHITDAAGQSHHSKAHMAAPSSSARRSSVTTSSASDHSTSHSAPVDVLTRHHGNTETTSTDTPNTLGHSHALDAESSEFESPGVHEDAKQPANQSSNEESTETSTSHNYESMNASQACIKPEKTRLTEGSPSSPLARARSIRIVDEAHVHAHSSDALPHTSGPTANEPRSNNNGSKKKSRNKVRTSRFIQSYPPERVCVCVHIMDGCP
jgi:hypothetical protein